MTDSTVLKIFQGSEWLLPEEIDRMQNDEFISGQRLLNHWQSCGQIFVVQYRNEKYYARYQFDKFYQPLPIIKAILAVLGKDTNAWNLATWFHFPNGWIATEGSEGLRPTAPKDALGRCNDVIEAARRYRRTYFA